MKTAVIVAATRQGRSGRKVADWVAEVASKEASIEVVLVDLKDHQLPFIDQATLPSMMDKKYPHEAVTNWSAAIDAAEAFIIVTPEYNHGYPGELKNAIDWLWSEWDKKPMGIVSYSSAATGGVRASEQLKLVLQSVGSRIATTSLAIPTVEKTLQNSEAMEHNAGVLVKTLDQLKELAQLPTAN